MKALRKEQLGRSNKQIVRIVLQPEVKKRIELGGTFANEPIITAAGKDSLFVNVAIGEGKDGPCLIKRPGFTSTTINAGQEAFGVYNWKGYSSGAGSSITVWDDGEIYVASGQIGDTNIQADPVYISEGYHASTICAFITYAGSGWYYPEDAGLAGATFVGDTTSGSANVTNITSTAGMYIGQLVTGTGIPASTRIQGIVVDSDITLTNNATVTDTGVTLTREGLAKIIDADFPAEAGKTLVSCIVYKDGYLFVLTKDGRIYNSSINSVNAWPGDFISTNEYADLGTGLTLYHNLIVAFNEFSTMFFEIVSASGSPLQRVGQLSNRVGADSQNHIVVDDNKVYWIGKTDSGPLGLWRFNGFQPERISETELDIFLSKTTFLYLSVVSLYGRQIALFSPDSGTNNFTLVYDIKDKVIMWWVLANDATAHIRQAVSLGGADTIRFIVDEDTGKYYLMNALGSTWQDDGSNTTATIQTTQLDFLSSLRKRLFKLWVVGDVQSSATTVAISWSDDDYVTFNTARNVDMANTNRYLNGCGMFRRRAFKLTNTSNTPLRIEALDLEIEEMEH